MLQPLHWILQTIDENYNFKNELSKNKWFLKHGEGVPWCSFYCSRVPNNQRVKIDKKTSAKKSWNPPKKILVSPLIQNLSTDVPLPPTSKNTKCGPHLYAHTDTFTVILLNILLLKPDHPLVILWVFFCNTISFLGQCIFWTLGAGSIFVNSKTVNRS